VSFLLHDPMLRPLGAAGQILPGCYLRFYATETTSEEPVYSDADLQTELTQPIVASSAGELPAIYGNTAKIYRRQLYNAADELLLDTDPMHPHVGAPAGELRFFRGDATARDAAFPPALWQVSNGDNGTIDFTGRSPVGAGTGFDVGDTGGSSGNVTSGSGGSVSAGVTGSTTLTASDIPAHRHFIAANVVGSADDAIDATHSIDKESSAGGDTEYKLRYSGSTDATVGRTSETGGGGGHTHTVPAISAHTHTVNVPRSPYGVVWILERKA
jgi:hypothetical protein